MHDTNPIITDTIITTATFGDDSGIPDTAYGTNIPVKIKSNRVDGDPRSVTVKIGNKWFPVSELEHLMDEIAAHTQAVKARNAAMEVMAKRKRNAH